MHKISVDTEGVAAYSATAHSMAGEMAAAGVNAAAAEPALLGPIFGLIGGDFLAAYATAHAGQVAKIGELSAVLTSLGLVSSGAVVTYAETDANHAGALHTTGDQLDG